MYSPATGGLALVLLACTVGVVTRVLHVTIVGVVTPAC